MKNYNIKRAKQLFERDANTSKLWLTSTGRVFRKECDAYNEKKTQNRQGKKIDVKLLERDGLTAFEEALQADCNGDADGEALKALQADYDEVIADRDALRKEYDKLEIERDELLKDKGALEAAVSGQEKQLADLQTQNKQLAEKISAEEPVEEAKQAKKGK